MLPLTPATEREGKLNCLYKPRSGGQDKARFAGISLCIALIVFLFLVFANQPYSVVSDAGYQALAALQFDRHEVSSINSVRLVDPADLSQTTECPLLLWAPFTTYAFLAGLKAGLPVGTTARTLAIVASLAGGMGWVWVASLLHLKGWRKALGVGFAAIYCLRTHLMLSMGTADAFIYAVAPWLIGAALLLSSKSRLRVTGQLIALSVLLSVACGAVYWVMYSGIVMGLAIVAAVSLAQFGSKARPPLPVLFSAFVLYGAAFALPPLLLRAANHHKSGSDLMEVSAKRQRPRNFAMVRSFLAEETFNAGAVLFTSGPGVNRLSQNRDPAIGWLLRIPGLLLLTMIVWLSIRYLPADLRNVSVLLTAVPLIGFAATRTTTQTDLNC